ncbi:GspE/PulE family protein [Polaromonas jejuensis]|uniref:GspE/PulE family protein n=1 Tax=Polaromonas jejuensis TaxID=457502 RepID=A0ABW0QH24_9BURK|nr:GspE/PulE family protein [Polaromonas jejuensis]
MQAMGALQLHELTPDFDIIPFIESTRRTCAAFHTDSQTLIVVTDPLNLRDRQWIEARLRQRRNYQAQWALASAGDLKAVLATHEKNVRAIDSLVVRDETVAGSNEKGIAISLQDIDSDDSMVVKLVNSTIYDALKAQASDIHLETQPNGLIIKYRVDGVLTEVSKLDGLETANQVISRIKVISELDIAERRIPQDGRFKVIAQARAIDFRVSIMPSIFGEDGVLRVLDRYQLSDQQSGLTLNGLGFSADDIGFIRTMAAKPYGLLLVTGPTGSGKTTTLYAVLSEIHTGLDKIITIEDPVEYQVPGVLQIPVNEAKGLTFARGLRSILRHDPDKIMVGEIRDPETAQIAVQAALTGHQVFTTVHANNVFDVLGRFSNMGVDAYSFVSALNGIVAQRLLRVNCAHCSIDEAPAAEAVRESGLLAEQLHSWKFRRGMGCAQCRGTGFKGRKAIAETLPLTDDLRDLIAEHAPMTRIKAVAQKAGVQTLRKAALTLVRNGETTLGEINRVTMVE